MIADKMKNMVANSSAIRAMFEEGNRLAGIYGAENVFDFSLGNPNVPAPEAVKNAIIEIVNDTDPVALHGYTDRDRQMDSTAYDGQRSSDVDIKDPWKDIAVAAVLPRRQHCRIWG